MTQLGVNIDHVATLREVRGNVNYPDPIEAALVAQKAGADNITVHLREDRRHIQDRDVYALKKVLNIPINLEVAVVPEMLDIALDVAPKFCCLVPEKREELTTEGGLDVIRYQREIADACERLANAGIIVSLFIDAEPKQILAAAEIGAPAIELHTGAYALAEGNDQVLHLQRIREAAILAKKNGLEVHAGHGLHLQNVTPIAHIEQIEALMIGHAIVARAIFVGMAEAIREMKALIN